MTPVIKTHSGEWRAASGNPTLTSLDGEVRAPLRTILSPSWTNEERESFGVFEVDTTPPEGERWTGEFAEENGVPVAIFEALPIPSLSELKIAKKNEIRQKGISIQREGYTHNFGTEIEPNWQVLQLREPTLEHDDEKNWMASLAAYTAVTGAGMGSVTGAKFRTETNAHFELTYAEGVAVLTAMFGWVSSIMQVVWDKCDEVDLCEDEEDLNAVDIDNGWPN